MGPLLPALAEYVEDPDEPFGNRAGFSTLVDQCREFRRLARVALGGSMSEDWQEPAALAALLLYDMTSRDAKNELLTCKLFAVLFGDSYRAHYGDASYAYDHGSWNKISALSYGAIDFASRALRAAESLFLIMHADGPPSRTFRRVAERVRLILDGKSQVDILGYLHVGSGGAADWAVESSKLCLSMYKNFTVPGRDRVALANFTRWASADPPECEGGVNFENAYYEIYAPESMADPMVCVRKGGIHREQLIREPPFHHFFRPQHRPRAADASVHRDDVGRYRRNPLVSFHVRACRSRGTTSGGDAVLRRGGRSGEIPSSLHSRPRSLGFRSFGGFRIDAPD